jgi:FixJ family two-component response regulator
VVDDDPNMRRALARLLSTFGFRTELFSSAEEFLDGAKASEACCLLVDVQLGGLSGLELVHRLTAGAFKRPIIVMSALENELTVSLGSAAGVVAYLRKPFSAHLLIAAINIAIE